MDIDLKNFGQAIRDRRKTLGLTQAKLAGLAGCTELFIYEIENGKTNPRFRNLLELIRILGLQMTLEEGKQTLSVKVIREIN